MLPSSAFGRRGLYDYLNSGGLRVTEILPMGKFAFTTKLKPIIKCICLFNKAIVSRHFLFAQPHTWFKLRSIVFNVYVRPAPHVADVSS